MDKNIKTHNLYESYIDKLEDIITIRKSKLEKAEKNTNI
jgi:hypothetical protein